VVDVAPKGLAIAISFINGRTTPRASKPLFADLVCRKRRASPF
jgi:hypothetical protein